MNRIIYSDNGVLKDISTELYRKDSKSFQFTYATDDFIYIGARLPFNQVYVLLSQASEADVSTKIEYYDGNQWREVVDLIDSTIGFKQSGHIEFTPDAMYNWGIEDTNYNGERIEGLGDVTIYDRYWLRISFDGALDQATLSMLGHKFSTDADLELEYPDLLRTNVLTAFKTGKTDWEDQHLKAAEILCKDLIDIGVIDLKEQILNWRDYTNAAICKVAEIAFNSFGEAYIEQSKMARQEYQDRLNKRIHIVDRNKNGREDVEERHTVTGFMKR